MTRVAEHLKNYVGHVEEKDGLTLALKDVEVKLSALKNARKTLGKYPISIKTN